MILKSFLISKATSNDSNYFKDLEYTHHSEIKITSEQAQIILKDLSTFSEQLNSSITNSSLIDMIREIHLNLEPLKDDILGIQELTEYIFRISIHLTIKPYRRNVTEYTGFFNSLLNYIHHICDLMGMDTRLSLDINESQMLGDTKPSNQNMHKYLNVAKIRKLVAAIHERKVNLLKEADTHFQRQIDPSKERKIKSSEVDLEEFVNKYLSGLRQEGKGY
jgi:hypothetical protein